MLFNGLKKRSKAEAKASSSSFAKTESLSLISLNIHKDHVDPVRYWDDPADQGWMVVRKEAWPS